MEALKAPVSVMTQWFRAKCREHPAAGLIGFKFKPYFDIDAAGQPAEQKWARTMAWLRDYNVSVLFSHRNPLDVSISGKTDAELDRQDPQHQHQHAHCRPSEHACISMHASVRVELPTGDNLLRSLDYSTKTRMAQLRMLTEYGIRHMAVTFEQLFDAQDNNKLANWHEVVQFLHPQAAALQWPQLTRALGVTVRVGSHHQGDRVRNYQQVQETLNGTAFQGLLHRR